jgi:hypothetical protein
MFGALGKGELPALARERIALAVAESTAAAIACRPIPISARTWPSWTTPK